MAKPKTKKVELFAADAYPPDTKGAWRRVPPAERKYRQGKSLMDVEYLRTSPSGEWEAYSREPGERYKGHGTWTLRWTPTVTRKDKDGDSIDFTDDVQFYGGETPEAFQAVCDLVESWLAAGLDPYHARLVLDGGPSYGEDPTAPPYYRDHGALYYDASESFRALGLEPVPFRPDGESHDVPIDHALWCKDDHLMFFARMHVFLDTEDPHKVTEEQKVGPAWDAWNRRDVAAMKALAEERRPMFEAAEDAALAERLAEKAERDHRSRNALDPDDEDPTDQRALCEGCGKRIDEGQAYDATGEFCSEECLDEYARTVEPEDDQEEPEAAPRPVPARTQAVVTQAVVRATQMSLF
jgi:hypothetical protein